jgi:hypothetical protein
MLLNIDFSTSKFENSAGDIWWVQITRPGSKKLQPLYYPFVVSSSVRYATVSHSYTWQ